MAKKTKEAPKTKAKAAAGAKKKKQTKARKPAARPEPVQAPSVAARPASEPARPHPDTVPPPPGAARDDRRGGGGKWAFGVFVFIVVAGVGGFLTWPHWSPALKSRLAGAPTPEPAAAGPRTPAPDDTALQKLSVERAQLRSELSRLIERIETVESAVDTVKKMVRATVPPSEKIAAGQSVEELTARLEELEKEGSTLKGLLQRVDQLEKSGGPAAAPVQPSADDAGGARAQAIVLAVANLRQIIATDRPFDDAVQSLSALAGENPEVKVGVAVLSKSAATGLPTLVTLQKRFQALAGKIVQASKVAEGRGWMERAANRISSLVTWRRIDDGGDGVSADAIVARAEDRLQAGNLKGAVDALADLVEMRKAAAVAQPWLDDAKARVAVEQAITTLHVHAISLLAPAKG